MEITEKVFSHETDEFCTITWEKIGIEYNYKCDNNHQVCQVVETDQGLLARPLGDGFSQLFPGKNIKNKTEEEAMDYVWELRN